MKFTKIMENKYVLYFVFLISLLHIISYMASGENDKVALFILIGIIAARFSKNMTIVLAVPLVGAHIYSASQYSRYFEGMTGSLGSTGQARVAEVKQKIQTAQSQQLNEGPTVLGLDGPESSNNTTSESMSLYKKNKRIDYASTLEDSYGDLNKILDGNGIKNLTTDTKRLMEQQKNLAGALKNMTPLIVQAQDMLKGFDVKGLTNVAKSLSNSG